MKRLRRLMMLLAVSMVFTAQAGAGLVAHWSFDNDFTANDSTYDATTYNGASIDANGRFGSAARFDKSQSQYAKTSACPFDPTANHSVSTWFYLDVEDMSTSSRYFVLETENYAVSFGLRDLGSGDVGQIYTNTSTSTSFNKTFAVGANQSWHHFAQTYDASTGVFKAYIDGALAATLSTTGTLDPMGYLVFGGHRSGTGRNFNGMIDDAAVFDEIISDDYIAYLAEGNAVPEPTSLVLLGLGSLAVARSRRNRK